MKRRAYLAFSYIYIMLLSSLSIADEAMKQQLIGTWSGSATNARGDIAKTTFELKSDDSFTGLVEMNQKPMMSYSGKWGTEGNKLVWNYLQSSMPLPESAKTDEDKIASVDATSLVLISEMSGQKRSFTREK